MRVNRTDSTLGRLAVGVSALLLGAAPSVASSHREAPFVAGLPRVDATDFYMFNSYEAGQTGMVTLIANYIPLQDAYGGPNYFALDPEARYEIHIDNDGDALEDITFAFRFRNALQDAQLAIGTGADQKSISIPLINGGAISAMDNSNLNVLETYTIDVVTGDRRSGSVAAVTAPGGGTGVFAKPIDNIGNKSIPDYAAYADAHVHAIELPGGMQGRVFVGQRKDPFVVNLGETFDLINTNPLGPVDGEADDLADKNVTSLILEVPAAFLTEGDAVIGGWTSASVRQARVVNPFPRFDATQSRTTPSVEGGAWTQVSRLGMPLVNEVVIGLRDKDRFNASEPKDDAQFLDYVTHPTLPALIEVLFGVTAPTAVPRADLPEVFLTGVAGLNQPIGVVPSEMLRLDTGSAVVAQGAQNNLGVLGGDTSGYPNGRRPGDDVVDISLRVVMGALLAPADAPDGTLLYTDGALVDDGDFDATFPYLLDPLPGSPN